jgi:hypothetical protein
LAIRVLDCFPSGAYSLSALLRLLDIVESDAVPTAAVECQVQPRLLINPKFAARHACTPEKLMMLVMHELHHVLLGHTTLFQAITPAQNFVLDAVINGMICRMFPEPQYTSFLTNFYDHRTFPHCLLRPPPGWPERPGPSGGIDGLPPSRRTACRAIHRALYADGGATYKEVFDLLPRLLLKSGVGDVPLLGGHGTNDAGTGATGQQSPVLVDIVRGIVDRWPRTPNPIQGRSLGDLLKANTVGPLRQPSTRGMLRELIGKVADWSRNGGVPRAGMDALVVQQPLPTTDRRSLVQRCLGLSPLLHVGQLPFQRIVGRGQRVHVYLDVSGSMNGVLRPLYGAIVDSGELVHPTVHLFSTKVADIRFDELRNGACLTTGGTDIACVAAHIAANQVKRALIVTDGFVGTPSGEHREILARTWLAVAYPGTSYAMRDLAEVADCTAVLNLGE